MELNDLLLLVKHCPITGQHEVVSESEFIRWMSMDTPIFFPQASCSTSNRAHPSFNGYLWFTENVDKLAEHQGCTIAAYLMDVVQNFCGFDFDRIEQSDEVEYALSFMLAGSLHPKLLTDLNVKGFRAPYPFAVKQIWDDPLKATSPPNSAEPKVESQAEPRPLWLL